MPSQEEFLAQVDYDKHDTFKFDQIGATIAGQIVSTPRVVNTPDIGNGGPQTSSDKLVIDIADRATGRTWSVWAKANMASAVAKAVREAGVRRLEEGGMIAIQFSAEGERKQPGFNPPKLYAARYQPPAGGVGLDQVAAMAGQPAQQAPQPQAVAQSLDDAF